MLVDTSGWGDHLRHGNQSLAKHLGSGLVWCHPFVIGEIACGRLTDRSEILGLLGSLPSSPEAYHDEVLIFVERSGIAGSGLGWIDVHLLASARLAGIGLWTLDRKLNSAAHQLGMSVSPIDRK